MVRHLLICVLIASPVLSGADKTPDKMLEVLRDLGGLQDQLKAMQKSLEGKLADLGQSSAAETHTAAAETSKSLAALSDRLQKSQQDQQDQQLKTLAAVTAVGSQVQALSTDVGTLREAMNDLTAAMARLSTQVNDVSTALKALQPPKSDASEISATDLFANAEGDRSGGKLDLALPEYTAYVAKFGTTSQAPDAQYYIGSIHYSNQEWDLAVKAFDSFLLNYPDNRSRMPAALFYKADALSRLGKASEAADTLKDLRKRFPNDPLAKRSLTVKSPGQLQ